MPPKGAPLNRGAPCHGIIGILVNPALIGTVRYNWPMSAHASQAFSIAHCRALHRSRRAAAADFFVAPPPPIFGHRRAAAAAAPPTFWSATRRAADAVYRSLNFQLDSVINI